MDSSQDSQLDNEQAMQLPDVQHTVVRLPEEHQRLFDQMKEQQAAMLRSSEPADAQVQYLICLTCGSLGMSVSETDCRAS